MYEAGQFPYRSTEQLSVVYPPNRYTAQLIPLPVQFTSAQAVLPVSIVQLLVPVEVGWNFTCTVRDCPGLRL